MNFKLPTLLIVLFLGVIYFLYTGLDKDPTLIPSPLIGKTVPDFKSTDLISGENITNKELLGKFYILNVWASWCYGCSLEHNHLMNIYKNNEIDIFGLNYKDEKNSAINWLKERGNPYKNVIVDVNGNIAIDYGVYGAPETFIINEDGVIIYKHVGPIDQSFYNKIILPLMKK